ncbi:MAG: glycosyltransferase [Deltaproteobacteria bacterium]
MRVTIIGPAPPLRGGVAAHTAGLVLALEEAGHRVEVLSFRRLYPRFFFPGRSPVETGRDGAGRDRDDGRVIDSLWPPSWLRAATRLADSNPDLLLLQWWHPALAPVLAAIVAAASLRQQTAVVVLCHNALAHEYFPLQARLGGLLLARAHGVLVHSEAVLRGLKEAGMLGDLPSRCSPMPLLADVVSGAPSAAEAKRVLGLDADAAVVLFFGLVRPYKGLELLLEAWDEAELPARARLVVAGESYLGAGVLEGLVANSKRPESVIVCDRYLDDGELAGLFAAADTLVLPHTSASQSGVMPLAVVAGLTVVCSDSGGLAEQLAALTRVGGRGGRHAVFKAGDARGLGLLLGRALGGPGPEDTNNSLQIQEVRGGWPETVEALEDLHRLLKVARAAVVCA